MFDDSRDLSASAQTRLEAPLRIGCVAMTTRVHPESVLLITLDSCRFDTAERAELPALSRLGVPLRAGAPAHFTYASHAAMWVGATPGLAEVSLPLLNPKAGRLFRLVNDRIGPAETDVFALPGRSIVEGFGNIGYTTIGCGGVDWFDDATPAGRELVKDFAHYRFLRGPQVEAQVQWLTTTVDAVEGPVFCFHNVAETHVPYWHDGAAWSRDENPCVPFGAGRNDRALCEVRQRACLEFADRHLATLLDRFEAATIVVTADHGDCWGEDGLWEHGITHPRVLEVPLWMRLRGVPVTP